MCVIDGNGNFTAETVKAARELAAKLIWDNKLTLDEIGTHYEVVGWKDCPKLWFNNREKFEEFKTGVKALLEVV
jgi:N-acetylmuramoyl-L-alanine amidase